MWKIKFLIPFLLLSCSSLNFQQVESPVATRDIYKIILDFTPEKTIYSAVDKTIYIMAMNKIHIYTEGLKINTIGGLGFEQYQFNKLTDITLAPDGKLLALDSFQKIIRKFDRYGNWVANINLKNLLNPTLLTVDSNGTLFVFDGNLQEIVTIQNYGSKRLYSFGKFIIEDPQFMNLTGNQITVYDKGQKKTFRFSRMGQFLDEHKGRVLFDRNNTFVLKNNYIQLIESDRKLAISPIAWINFFIIDKYLILNTENSVKIVELVYEEN